MLSHVVLFRPRTDLSRSEREAFFAAFEAAVRDIPSVRGARIGRRVTFGAGYEQGMPAFDFSAIIEFDDLAGLQSYLVHPTHVALGEHFGSALEQALVYDFTMMQPEEVRHLVASLG